MHPSRYIIRALASFVVIALLLAPALAAKKPSAAKQKGGEAVKDPAAPPKDAQWTL